MFAAQAEEYEFRASPLMGAVFETGLSVPENLVERGSNIDPKNAEDARRAVKSEIARFGKEKQNNRKKVKSVNLTAPKTDMHKAIVDYLENSPGGKSIKEICEAVPGSESMHVFSMKQKGMIVLGRGQKYSV